MAYSSSKPVTGGSLVAADIRENFRALKEDGIVVATDASISQAKLKTSQGSVSSAVAYAVNLTLPGGEYGFYPQVKIETSGNACSFALASSFPSLTYVTNIGILPGADVTGYAQQRYVTSSGEIFWIFILRVAVDYTETGADGELVEHKAGDILSMYQAPDHPCFGNGGKPSVVQHPFGSYDPETQEIIVINPTHTEVEKMKKEGERGEDEPDKDLLEVLIENYDIDEESEPAWPSIPVTVGLPKDYETKAIGSEITSIKKVIPRPDYVGCKSLKRKVINIETK